MMGASMKRIPMVDLGWQWEQIRPAVELPLSQLMREGKYIGGEAVESFKKEFSAWHGELPVVTCGNGSDALYLALRTLGIGNGCDVVTMPNSFVATAHAIERVGARASFCDVDPELHTMRPESLEKVIRRETRAVIVVHLYGHPCDMGPILEIAKAHDLFVIEDCAQSCGADWNGKRVGTLGDAGCFSFFPTKTLGAAGDGGAVVFQTEEDAKIAGSLARQGFQKKNDATSWGINSRLDAVQALVLTEKLRHLTTWNTMRRGLAEVYHKELSGVRSITLPREAAWARHVYHLYVIQCQGKEHRDRVRAHLAEQGIDTQIHYERLITEQMPYASRQGRRRGIDAAEQLVGRILSLPIYPGMSTSDVIRVCDAIKEVK